MSALDLAQISACLRTLSRHRLTVTDLPTPVLGLILSFCDTRTRQSAALAARCFYRALAEIPEQDETSNPTDMNDNLLRLSGLPADVLLGVFRFLDRTSLARTARTCSRFRDLAYSDCLWLAAGRAALAANQTDAAVRARSQETLSARDRVRVGTAWSCGAVVPSLLAVQNTRFMPRLQLEAKRLWVSWGRVIWCHPRLPGGGVATTTSRVLRAHTDDVSRFVVEGGMVVSGGRDRALCGWGASRGEFLFARRNCHAGEITAVDVTGRGGIVVTGSRDRTCLVWALQEDPARDRGLVPIPAVRLEAGDRVWSVAASPSASLLAVGTAATRGCPPLRLFDLASGAGVLDMGTELRNGAGMLDLAWTSPHTFLACGYDTFTRLWDTRCGRQGAVRAWEEPNDESVYCLATDRVNCLVTGTSRHGRVRVWDLRAPKWLYMKHAAPARRGQSSPVYSLAMDASNLYAALDQSLNHFGFSGQDGKRQHRRH